MIHQTMFVVCLLFAAARIGGADRARAAHCLLKERAQRSSRPSRRGSTLRKASRILRGGFGAWGGSSYGGFGNTNSNQNPFGQSGSGSGSGQGFSQSGSTGGGIFGQSQKQSGSIFGGGGMFGQPSTSFGQPSTNAATGTGFGQPARGGFVQAQATTGFGQPATSFGQSGASFGQGTGGGSFGTLGGSSFGQTGFNTANRFGSTSMNTGLFGTKPSSSSFGNVYGSSQPRGLDGGTSCLSAYGEQGTPQPWTPTMKNEMKDGATYSMQYMHITGMPAYEKKTVEELRWEDYQQGRKEGSTAAANTFASPATAPAFNSFPVSSSLGGSPWGASKPPTPLNSFFSITPSTPSFASISSPAPAPQTQQHSLFRPAIPTPAPTSTFSFQQSFPTIAPVSSFWNTNPPSLISAFGTTPPPTPVSIPAGQTPFAAPAFNSFGTPFATNAYGSSLQQQQQQQPLQPSRHGASFFGRTNMPGGSVPLAAPQLHQSATKLGGTNAGGLLETRSQEREKELQREIARHMGLHSGNIPRDMFLRIVKEYMPVYSSNSGVAALAERAADAKLLLFNMVGEYDGRFRNPIYRRRNGIGHPLADDSKKKNETLYRKLCRRVWEANERLQWSGNSENELFRIYTESAKHVGNRGAFGKSIDDPFYRKEVERRDFKSLLGAKSEAPALRNYTATQEQSRARLGLYAPGGSLDKVLDRFAENRDKKVDKSLADEFRSLVEKVQEREENEEINRLSLRVMGYLDKYGHEAAMKWMEYREAWLKLGKLKKSLKAEVFEKLKEKLPRELLHFPPTAEEARQTEIDPSQILASIGNEQEEKLSRDSFSNEKRAVSPSRMGSQQKLRQQKDAKNVDSIRALLPSLKDPSYYVRPSLDRLRKAAVQDPSILKRVEDFTVGHCEHGQVRFLGETDIRGIDLSDVISFRKGVLEVYSGRTPAPPIGMGLNKPAVVTLNAVHPKRNSTTEQRMYLERITLNQKAEFLGYDPELGRWRMKVKHFTN